MEIVKVAQAGSFESSDIMILIEPIKIGSGRKIEIDSTVMSQYGEQLKSLICKKLDNMEVVDVHMIVKDKGALAPTINARIETAVKRAAGIAEGIL